MILKYNDFYTLVNIVKYVSIKNNNIYKKLCLLKYYHQLYKFNLISSSHVSFKNFNLNKYILFYLFKFFNTYIEVTLVKYSKKKYFNMYKYLNYCNFLFKFLNWYCNFLFLNVNIFIADEKILKLNNFNIYSKHNKKFVIEILNRYNCKFFINLDNRVSKNYYKLFYELDVYMLDLSSLVFYKFNKNNVLQLLFLMRNLIILSKIYKNL